jgi:proliferating cell nuclear antigen
MEIVIKSSPKVDIFAGLFQHIKMFGENVNILFGPDKMYVQGMDSSHISIFEIHLPVEWFDSYNIQQESGITIGINGNFLYKVLNSRDKGQNMKLSLENANSDILQIHFDCEDPGVYDKYFEIPLLDVDMETMQIPTMEYEAEFSMASITLSVLVEQLRIFGDTLNILCSEEQIQLGSSSECNGKMNVNIPIDDLNAFSINEGETLNVSYSLAQMHNICLYNKLAKDADVSLTSNFPIKIVYALGGHDDAKLVFYLAPKVDDD